MWRSADARHRAACFQDLDLTGVGLSEMGLGVGYGVLRFRVVEDGYAADLGTRHHDAVYLLFVYVCLPPCIHG